MSSKSFIDTIVGAGIICFVAFCSYYFYNNFGNETHDMCHFRVFFNNIDGLSVGSDVRLSGIKVGSVEKQTVDKETYMAVVDLSIDKSFCNLPRDTVISVVNEGLLGGKYVKIMPGVDDDYFKDGDTIKNTQSSISIESLLGKLLLR